MEIERLTSKAITLEYELNRLAGTLVNDMPTLGKATAALWWIGHQRELEWAAQNMLTPNQATGCEALLTDEGFTALDGQTLEVVEGDAVIGTHVLKVTTAAAGDVVSPPQGLLSSSIALTDPIAVDPWSIYTASLYTRMEQGGVTNRRANFMHLVWYDADGAELSRYKGDHHASKEPWNLSWVTWHAPETAATVRVELEWEAADGEVFFVDKAALYNGSNPQAWAYPNHAATNLPAGLQAHLNMKAGIFNPDDFLPLDEVANLLAGSEGLDLPSALSLVPSPNPLVVSH